MSRSLGYRGSKRKRPVLDTSSQHAAKPQLHQFQSVLDPFKKASTTQNQHRPPSPSPFACQQKLR